MNTKRLALILLVLFAVVGCKKKNTPQEKNYFFSYKVRIGKKIQEPTIISGFYGKVLKYEGNFQPGIDADTGEAVTREPEPARNEVLIFTADQKEKIDAAAYEKDGITFYSLKKIKKAKIEPKYVITPNKSGFYQIDLGTGEYLALISIKGNRGYYNGGVGTLSATTGSLKELNMRIDYNASF